MKKLKMYLTQLLCRHRDKAEIFICYQDRYVHERCKKCGKDIYAEF
jgi:hypothetical protein